METVQTTSAALGAAIGLGPIRKKVRFLTEEAAIEGFGLLLRSGGAETLGQNTYGLSSLRQIRLLEKNKVPFEEIQ
jgi:hypothetical protein